MGTGTIFNVTTGEETTIEEPDVVVSAEAKLQALRMERNLRLSVTDVWALSDRTMTQAQKDYRQALRDITENATSLDDVSWPTEP